MRYIRFLTLPFLILIVSFGVFATGHPASAHYASPTALATMGSHRDLGNLHTTSTENVIATDNVPADLLQSLVMDIWNDRIADDATYFRRAATLTTATFGIFSTASTSMDNSRLDAMATTMTTDIGVRGSHLKLPLSSDLNNGLTGYTAGGRLLRESFDGHVGEHS